jgi:hypothetical protein
MIFRKYTTPHVDFYDIFIYNNDIVKSQIYHLNVSEITERG